MAEFSTAGAAHSDLSGISAGYPFYMVSLLAGLPRIQDQLYGRADRWGQRTQAVRFITLPQLADHRQSGNARLHLDNATVYPDLDDDRGGPIRVTEMLSTFTYKLAFSSTDFLLASTSTFVILLLSMGVAWFNVRKQRAGDE
jgi:multiple sugar transport system permease protein